MEKDWGFAALIEYRGKRILFDTGDNPDILARNAKAKGVDLSNLDTTLELRELSLAIDTPEGIVLVVGCSHPGIDKIVEAAAAIEPRIHLIAGGLHLVVAKDADIDGIVATLRDRFKVAYIAPGHCTGEPTFAALQKAFGGRYLYAGLGTALALGAMPHPL
jgi:7,8-dihydropterin-6-yl-methyl-4-(beta-D-ribofuranosyl)aminobenzene 5'-phosphate synthase